VPLASPRYLFSREAVEQAPNFPGVYALYENEKLLCIGVALGRGERSIRARLLEHLQGSAFARRITHYQWEISSDPIERRSVYIEAIEGGAPFCEDGASRPSG
jgi:hypothetical protein